MVKKRGFRSVRMRLAAWFSAMALVPLLGFATLTGTENLRRTEEQAKTKLESARDLRVFEVDRWIKARLKETAVAAQDTELVRYDACLDSGTSGQALEEAQNYARILLRHYDEGVEDCDELCILDRHTGVVRLSSRPNLEGQTHLDYPLIASSLAGDAQAVTDAYITPVNGKPMVALCVPIHAEGAVAKTGSVLVFRLALEQSVFPLLADRSGLGTTGEILLVNKANLAINSLRWKSNRPLDFSIHTEQVDRALKAETGVLRGDDYRGYPVLAAYGFIPVTGWAIVAKQDLTEVYAPAIRALMTLVATVVLSLFVVVMVALLVSRNLSRPLRSIAATARALSAGDMAARIEINRQDELGVLADTLNSMAASLQSQTRIREGSSRTIEALVTAPDLKGFAMALLKRLMQHTDACIAAFYVADPEKNTMSPLAAIGASVESLTTFDIEALEGELGRAVAMGAISRHKDIPEDTRFTFKTLGGEAIPREVVTMPIMGRDGTAAVLVLGTLTGFSGEAILMVQHLWVIIGTALSNLTASEETRAMAQKLSTKNRELEQTTEKLRAQANELAAQSEELQCQTEELRAQAEELEAQQAQVAEADRLKSEFLSNMSHELRTPLNSVMALSQLMLSRGPGKKPEQDVEYLRIIERNGRHLLNLINDILDLSKIEAGRMELQMTEFSPRTAVARAIETVEPLAEEKGLSLETDIETLPAMIGDESKLHQILLNLLSNAVKFTEKGTVSLSVFALGPFGGSSRVRFVVRDTGMGIAPNDLPHIFDKFRQADGSTTRRHGGTGLGLAICQELAHLLGGIITVESIQGQGSTFTLDIPVQAPTETKPVRIPAPPVNPLPRRPAPAKKEAEKPPQHLLKQTILVVDDDPGVRTLLSDHLEKEGFKVITAQGGEEGLRLAREHLPFAITLDVLMPDMDGWEVIRQLKADSHTHDIPVIMISVSDDQATGLALGATSFLVKPVDRQILIGELQKISLLRKVRHILVVDDDRSTRDFLAATLKERGYIVSLAAGGGEALDALRTSHPDVVVLDLMMPEVDGFQVLERMRHEPATREVPVIVATAKDLSSDERSLLEQSVHRIIAKGTIDGDRILKDLEAALRQVRKRGTMGNMDDRRIVLVVEDNDVAVLQIRAALEDNGYMVMVARSGTEAMECINKTLPDALILDLMMPEMDGFQVLDEIRATAWTADLPVLVLTAKELTQAERDRLQSGKARQLLQKGSVDRDQLVANVRRLFEVQEPQSVPPTEPESVPVPEPARPTTKTVLIVEDHADNLFTVAAILDELGCTHIEARDGKEGIAMAREHRPGLILMDIQLPGLSGTDAAMALKADKATAGIPIVALTAKTMKGDRERILASGCDDYVSKPIEQGEIERVVRRWLA